MPDNASTELALIKLLSDQLADVRSLSSKVEHLAEHIGRLEHQSQHRHEELMNALEDVQAAINEAATAQTDLTTAVNAAIVRIGTPPASDAALTAVAVAIRANAASDVALKDALNVALNPPVVIPPTP